LAATTLGLTAFGVVLLVYAPLLIANPRDELNYVADTLLFSGSVLALASILPKEQHWRLWCVVGNGAHQRDPTKQNTPVASG